MACVHKHKDKTGCSGQREPVQFVPIREFNDNTLVKDFHFLEQAQTVINRKAGSEGKSQKRALLKKECWERNIHLKLFPNVFSKAKTNTSHVRKAKQGPEETGVSTGKEIWWRVSWIFQVRDETITLTDTCVSEYATLHSLLLRFFENNWKAQPTKHQLLEFAPAFTSDTLNITLHGYPNEVLSPEMKLGETLKNKQIYEYPVFTLTISSSSGIPRVSEDPLAMHQQPF